MKYSHQTLGPLSVISLRFLTSKHSTQLDKIPTLILPSHQPLGTLSVLFPSDFFIKTLYKPRPNPHSNIILPSTPGPPKCSLSFSFFIKTLYTPRQNTQLNIILPSNLGYPKCSVSFKILHQTPCKP